MLPISGSVPDEVLIKRLGPVEDNLSRLCCLFRRLSTRSAVTIPSSTQKFTRVSVSPVRLTILTLYGYVLAGNTIAGGLLSLVDLSRRAKIALVAGIALATTAVAASPGVALVAHVTGLVLGVIAERLRLLRVGEPESGYTWCGEISRQDSLSPKIDRRFWWQCVSL